MSEFAEEYSDVTPKEEPDPKPDPKPSGNDYWSPEWLAEQEEIAAKDGWAPRDQWKGDPNEWVPAPIFNVRGPLFHKIKEQKNTIESLKGEYDGLKSTVSSIVKKTQDYERQQAEKKIAELQKDKVKFMEEGDYEKVVKADAEIDEAKKAAEEPVEEETGKPEISQEGIQLANQFAEDNKWYFSDSGLQRYADTKARVFMSSNPNASAKDVLDHMVEETQKAFPDKFRNAPEKSPVGEQTSEATPTDGGKKRVGRKDLDKTHQEILDGFIENNNTGLPDKEYEKQIIEQWQEIGEI